MNSESNARTPSSGNPFQIVGLNYVSLYIKDFQAAIEFYSQVFGSPETAVDFFNFERHFLLQARHSGRCADHPGNVEQAG